MGDIAGKAGVSRPALYLLFPDKDASFVRVIAPMDDRTQREIGDALAGLPTLGDKLLRAGLDWGLHGVALTAAHPDAADLFDLRFPAVRQVYANVEARVAELIAGPVADSGIAATATELAHMLVYGMRGLREGAADLDQRRRLIARDHGPPGAAPGAA